MCRHEQQEHRLSVITAEKIQVAVLAMMARGSASRSYSLCCLARWGWLQRRCPSAMTQPGASLAAAIVDAGVHPRPMVRRIARSSSDCWQQLEMKTAMLSSSIAEGRECTRAPAMLSSSIIDGSWR